MADIDTESPEFKQAVDQATAAKLALETDGLRANRDDIIKEKKAIAAKLKQFDDVDLEEYQSLRASAAKAADDKAIQEGDWKKLETQLVEQHTTNMGIKDANITNLTAALEDALVVRSAVEAIAAHKGSTQLLLPHVRSAVKMQEADGKYTAVVVDERGDPKLAPDAKSASDFMSIDQYVESLRSNKDYARAFDGTGSSGGGASITSDGVTPTGTVDGSNPLDFGRNLEGIAAGKTQVT